MKHVSVNTLFNKSIVLTLMLLSMGAAQVSTPTSSVVQTRPSTVINLNEDVVIILGNKVQALAIELWSMLARIKSAKDADAQAAQFLVYAKEIAVLDRQLFDLSDVHKNSATQVAHDEMRKLIICSYQTLDDEFNSMYTVHCYGSEKMIEAFNQALNIGFFDISHAPTVIPVRLPLNEEEQRNEFERLKKLLIPDRAIIIELCSIHDEATAARATKNLLIQIATLHALNTPAAHLYRPFHNESKEYKANNEAIIQLLWKIRSEYIRLVGVTALEGEIMAQLCNELDELYLCIEESHNLCFPIVFDSSFLSDMDDAYSKRHPTNH